MADEKKTTVVLDLDNKDFTTKIKDGLGLIGKLGDGGNLSGLISGFTKVGVVAGIAYAAVKAIGAAVDFAKMGEDALTVEKSFDNIAKSAGLAAETIKNDLVSASHGLADDTEILQAANKAILTMGDTAKRLPEIMDLARKASANFGGTLIENFEGMSKAIANGNEKQLKQYGIIIDSDKVIKEYAKSVGVSAKYLDDHAKKQALANSAIDKANASYKNLSTEGRAVTEFFGKFNTLWNGAIEAVAKWIAQSRFVQDSFKTLGQSVDWVSKKLGFTQTTLAEYQEKLTALRGTLYDVTEAEKKYGDSFGGGRSKQIQAEIEETKKLIAAMKEKKAASEAGGGEGPEGGGVKNEELLNDRKKFYSQLTQLKSQALEADIQNATTVQQVETDHLEQKKIREQQYILDKQLLEQQASALGIMNTAQYNEGIKALKTQHDADLAQMDLKLHDDRMQALQNYQDKTVSVFDGISAAFKKNGEANKKGLKDFGKTGDMVYGAYKKNALAAFRGVADGSQSAGDAMRGFMYGTIADTAEAKGTEMILTGIWPPNPIAIGGGMALLALAQALRSQSQGSKGVGGGKGSAGGGGASPTSHDDLSSKPIAGESKTKAVSINFHGDFVNTEQSRTRFMDMIRESGDYTDFNINKIGGSQ